MKFADNPLLDTVEGKCPQLYIWKHKKQHLEDVNLGYEKADLQNYSDLC